MKYCIARNWSFLYDPILPEASIVDIKYDKILLLSMRSEFLEFSRINFNEPRVININPSHQSTQLIAS
jgi:hypothetical protein